MLILEVMLKEIDVENGTTLDTDMTILQSNREPIVCSVTINNEH